jgi:hypothetical protein
MNGVRLLFSALLLSVFFGNTLQAATWKEPWLYDVAPQATHLLKVKIVERKGAFYAEAEPLKVLFGNEKKVPNLIRIEGFFALKLCIQHGDPQPGIWLDKIDTCYLLLQHQKGKTFALATPTTGVFPTRENVVAAHFRHSYHREELSVEEFEWLMGSYVKSRHGDSLDTASILDFCKKWLVKAPAIPEWSTYTLFSRQQAAMEMIYALKLPGFLEELKVFAFHLADVHKMAAFRAMRGSSSAETTQFIFDEVRNPDLTRIVQYSALQTLIESSFKPERESVERFLAVADDRYVGFGGDIRDPRICTSFPGIKTMLESLLKTIN